MAIGGDGLAAPPSLARRLGRQQRQYRSDSPSADRPLLRPLTCVSRPGSHTPPASTRQQSHRGHSQRPCPTGPSAMHRAAPPLPRRSSLHPPHPWALAGRRGSASQLIGPTHEQHRDLIDIFNQTATDRSILQSSTQRSAAVPPDSRGLSAPCLKSREDSLAMMSAESVATKTQRVAAAAATACRVGRYTASNAAQSVSLSIPCRNNVHSHAPPPTQ